MITFDFKGGACALGANTISTSAGAITLTTSDNQDVTSSSGGELLALSRPFHLHDCHPDHRINEMPSCGLEGRVSQGLSKFVTHQMSETNGNQSRYRNRDVEYGWDYLERRRDRRRSGFPEPCERGIDDLQQHPARPHAVKYNFDRCINREKLSTTFVKPELRFPRIYSNYFQNLEAYKQHYYRMSSVVSLISRKLLTKSFKAACTIFESIPDERASKRNPPAVCEQQQSCYPGRKRHGRFQVGSDQRSV